MNPYEAPQMVNDQKVLCASLVLSEQEKFGIRIRRAAVRIFFCALVANYVLDYKDVNTQAQQLIEQYKTALRDLFE